MSYLDNAVEFPSNRLKQRYVKHNNQGLEEIILSIDGISCSGCVTKVENRIRKIAGVKSIQLNPSTHRAQVIWNEKTLSVAELLRYFDTLGYPASPYDTRSQESQVKREGRQALIRITVAAALGMQVMMIATALYFGDAFGIEERYRYLLRFAATVLTIPVLLFCATPFFIGAWRNLKSLTVGVDVPISLALLVAFLAASMPH